MSMLSRINGVPLEKVLDKEAPVDGVPVYLARGYANGRTDQPKLPPGFAPKPLRLGKAPRRKGKR